ncbi:helix-turn-helix domain-containing protein [Bacillus sp. NPDC094106]|uniref:helix-turn-helix domain-containing protein n=1 Tax=Bacillus sp. NPDC094106 TaxID=3363949 RepID=UPI0038177844
MSIELTDKKQSLGNDLGKFLKMEREKKGLSLEKVGKAIEVSASYLHRLENGSRKNPSITILEKLCAFFTLDPQKVLEMAGLSTRGDSTICVKYTSIPLERIESITSFMLNIDTSDFSQIIDLTNQIKKLQSDFKK